MSRWERILYFVVGITVGLAVFVLLGAPAFAQSWGKGGCYPAAPLVQRPLIAPPAPTFVMYESGTYAAGCEKSRTTDKPLVTAIGCYTDPPQGLNPKRYVFAHADTLPPFRTPSIVVSRWQPDGQHVGVELGCMASAAAVRAAAAQLEACTFVAGAGKSPCPCPDGKCKCYPCKCGPAGNTGCPCGKDCAPRVPMCEQLGIPPGGVSREQMPAGGGERFVVNGVDTSREDVRAALGGPGTLQDDSKLPWLTVIGDDATRAAVRKDFLLSTKLGAIKVKLTDFPPGHKLVGDFAGPGIYLQAPNGRPLATFTNYEGADKLADGVSAALAGYDESKDPGPGKPYPKTPSDPDKSPDAPPSAAGVSVWVVLAAGAVLLLILRRKS